MELSLLHQASQKSLIEMNWNKIEATTDHFHCMEKEHFGSARHHFLADNLQAENDEKTETWNVNGFVLLEIAWK